MDNRHDRKLLKGGNTEKVRKKQKVGQVKKFYILKRKGFSRIECHWFFLRTIYQAAP